jgi:hypothetical protein
MFATGWTIKNTLAISRILKISSSLLLIHFILHWQSFENTNTLLDSKEFSVLNVCRLNNIRFFKRIRREWAWCDHLLSTFLHLCVGRRSMTYSIIRVSILSLLSRAIVRVSPPPELMRTDWSFDDFASVVSLRHELHSALPVRKN